MSRDLDTRDDAGFEPFDLSVHLGPEMVPWLSASSRMGVVHGVPCTWGGVPPLQDLLDLVYDYADAVRFAEPVPAPPLAAALGELVFGDPQVLELFQATRGSAADRGRQLLARILASPHLAALPWELLPDPAHGRSELDRRYLALAPDAHVARLARGRTYPATSARLEPPLNLLVVLSSPVAADPSDDSLAFDIFEVKSSLLAELQPLVDAGLLSVDFEDRPTLENLRRRVGGRRCGYHLFHYVGHALPERLILEDESGRREDQGSARFSEILRLCPDLRLAVFAGCETARPGADPMAVDARSAVGGRDLLSLADVFVQAVCPTVIGMQAVLPFRTEHLFTRFFYQGIATGYSVADAVRLARGATRGDRRVGGDLLDWSVPALFLGGGEPGPLVDRVAKGNPPPRAPRHELKLGLRQEETRFFARDVPLRQAVDVLAGRTRERVLVVTGPAGVGKTALVDRALGEVDAMTREPPGNAASHVLYLELQHLAPELLSVRDAVLRGDRDAGRALRDYQPDTPLRRLCELVAELLTRGDGAPRACKPGWSAREWWDLRLLEDLTRARFTLVLDSADLFDDLERACLVRLLTGWLAEQLDAVRSAGGEALAEQLETIAAVLRNEEPAPEAPDPARSPLLAALGALPAWLDLPARLAPIPRRALAAVTGRLTEELLAPGTSLDAVLERFRKGVPSAEEQAALRGALRACAGSGDALGHALTALAGRRSRSRIVIVGREASPELLALSSDERFEMRLGRLTWPETWRWIRRNLPGLVGYGEAYLARLWARLGTELERWEDLERAVLASHGAALDLEQAVALIAPRARRPGMAMQGAAARRRGERPLRLAVAGPYMAEPPQVAEAFTRLASEHGLGGRVVVDDPGNPGALAVLIDEATPFERGMARPQDVLDWIQRVAAHRPDVVLLDYGRDVPLAEIDLDRDVERSPLHSLSRRCLLVAAGGNGGDDGLVTLPACFPEVLGVGPMQADGAPQPYASRVARLGKPDLFMEDNLEGTALFRALDREKLPGDGGTQGSSFAALHAAAAAALIWSLLPSLSPGAVRRAMIEAARPLKGSRGDTLRGLRLADAVALARKTVVEQALLPGPCSLQTLSAITGLDVRIVLETLEGFRKRGRVRRLANGRLDRFELL